MAVRTKVVKPKVTTKKLAEEYPAIILVNRGGVQADALQGPQAGQDLRHRRRPGRAGDAGRALPRAEQGGQPGLARAELRLGGQPGRHRSSPAGDPENPIKARWLGIFDGAGIHGTDAVGSIGSAASHGCIRMRIPDVSELYDQVPVGAPVYIA